MIRMLLLVLLFIGLFRFITRILFPILRISSAVRGQMRHMQQQANQQSYAGGGYNTKQSTRRQAAPKEDYIEYEEVK